MCVCFSSSVIRVGLYTDLFDVSIGHEWDQAMACGSYAKLHAIDVNMLCLLYMLNWLYIGLLYWPYMQHYMLYLLLSLNMIKWPYGLSAEPNDPF